MSHRSIRHRVPAVLVALVVAVTAALVSPGPAQAAVQNNYLLNNGRYSAVGVGVWHDNHTGGYDGILPANRNTVDQWGWDHVSAFYIGTGYCADLFRTPAANPGTWTFVDTVSPGRTN